MVVNSAFGLNYFGSVVNLQNFTGPVIISGNNFTNNILQYTSCAISANINTSLSVTTKYPYLTNMVIS